MVAMQHMHQQQPATMMRMPEHFAPPRVNDTAIQEDGVSSLGEGTCKVIHVPNYSPSTDPSISPLARIFVPPESIDILVEVPITPAPAPAVKQKTPQPSTETPDWLKLPQDKKSKMKMKKAIKEQKKKDKKKHRRSQSLVASSSSHDDAALAKPDIVKTCFSAETPAVVLKESSPPMINRIVIGKGGRPVYAHQQEAEVDENDEDDSPSLASLKDLEHINYEDFRPPQRTEKSGAVSPSLSFTDSYETTPTTDDEQKQGIVAVSNSNEPSARKGMVRREFGRRLFFGFGKKNHNSNAVAEEAETKTKKNKKNVSTATSKKDKTAKTVLADWKQVSGSCMV